MGAAESRYRGHDRGNKNEGVIAKVLAGSDKNAASRELNDLRAVYSKIKGLDSDLELRSILRLPEIKAQIAEGDISASDLESVWLETCAIEGAKEPGSKGTEQEATKSWGVCTGLSFEGFVHFLRLCEARVSLPKEVDVPSSETARIGRDLVAARHRLIGLVRATLIVHQKGEGENMEAKDADESAKGEQLHNAMVRAALEEGLAHHTRDTLRELMRTGIYKASAEEAKRERDQRRAELDARLGSQASHEELIQSGILLEQTPKEHSQERAKAADTVKDSLERRPSKKDLIEQGLVWDTTPEKRKLERAMVAGKLQHDLEHRDSFEELQQKGIVMDTTANKTHTDHLIAGAKLAKNLDSRPPLEDVKAAHIIKTRDEDVAEQMAAEDGSEATSAADRDVTPDVQEEDRRYLSDKLEHALEHRPEYEGLQQKGVALDMTPEQAHEEHAHAAEEVERGLQSRPSPEEMQDSTMTSSDEDRKKAREDAERALDGLLADSQKPSKEETEAQQEEDEKLSDLADKGVVHRETADVDAQQMNLTKDVLAMELEHRCEISDLKDRGIYRSEADEEKQLKERSKTAEQLNELLQERPDVEDLMVRGLLEAKVLKDAWQELDEQGPIETAYQTLQWPVLAIALEQQVVTVEMLEKGYAEARRPGGERMCYEEFDAFLALTKTTQIAEEPLSLKLWCLMHLRPELEEQQHHESNRRRQAIIAQDLEAELEKRQSIARLTTKGVYIKGPPQELTGVKIALEHSLAHRAGLDELQHKGVYMEGVAPGDLEESHRNARNALEGALALRPERSALEEKGYLEADELEEAFAELVLEYKHEKRTADRETQEKDDTGEDANTVSDADRARRLLLPSERLRSWSPVRAMVEAGTAVEGDVDVAIADAETASSSSGLFGVKREDEGAMIDFVGFLVFVHALDVQVDDLDADEGDEEAKVRHEERRMRRRERASEAAVGDQGHRTLKERLLTHLQSRPAKEAPETQRIAKEFHTSETVEDERKHVKEQLEEQLKSRPEPSEVTGAGAGEEGERAAKIKEIEFKMNKRMLVHRIAKRPPSEILRHKGILHEQSPEEERRQRKIAAETVERNLASRPSLEEMEKSGRYRDDPDALKQEQEEIVSKVAKGLEERPSRMSIVARGIVAPSGDSFRGKSPIRTLDPTAAEKAESAAEAALAQRSRETKHRLVEAKIIRERGDMATRWEMELKKEVLEEGLDRRADLEELKNKGVYRDTTPMQHELNRHLVEKCLEKSLEKINRPTKSDLQHKGILIDSTPRAMEMEHYLAARNVKHGLEARDDLQALQSKGIYQEKTPERAAHEMRLTKALLNKRLNQTFDPHELEELKRKGIYREAEHDKLDAERELVTQQLARLVSTRPDPDRLVAEHPKLMETSTLGMVFEERVMPRFVSKGYGKGVTTDADDNPGRGPEHVVSLEALMTWPDVQEHVATKGGEAARLEMTHHFELCDADGDGFITFSQFLRWVELCDLNPDDHLQVEDADLENEYIRLGGAQHDGLVFDEVVSCRLVQRWATSAVLDVQAMINLWGGPEAASERQHLEKFKAFCWECESRSAAAHQERVEKLQAEASEAEAKAKQDIKTKLAAKLTSRPDLQELMEKRVYRPSGVDAATELLERDLISNDLKQQLLARPALEQLERRGIKPPDDYGEMLQKNSEKLEEALDSTMQHDDAVWRSHPDQLEGGSRSEVSDFLQRSLAKRLSRQELSNKGIYVVDTDANYALLLHEILETYFGFEMTAAELVSHMISAGEKRRK